MERIVFVIGSLGSGGSELFLLWLVSTLAKENYKVEIWTLTGGILEPSFRQAGSLLEVGTKQEYSFIRKSLDILCLLKRLRNKYGNRNIVSPIICSFLPHSHVFVELFRLFGRRLGFTHLLFRRGRDFYFFKTVVGTLEKFLCNHEKCHYVGNSLVIKNDLLTNYPNSKKRIHMLINPVVERFYYSKESRIKRENVVICVANLIPYKNHIELLQSFKLALKLGLPGDTRLIIVGEDRRNYKKVLEQKVKELGIQSHVRFLGRRTDIDQLLFRSKIFCLLSKEEGSSNSLLQAMAAGCICITSPVGMAKEMLLNGVTGYVSYDMQHIAYLISHHLNNEDVKGIAENAHMRVATYCSPLATIRQFKSILKLVEVS